MQTYNWPYKNELDITETLSCDVLVLGGGLAGCYDASHPWTGVRPYILIS